MPTRSTLAPAARLLLAAVVGGLGGCYPGYSPGGSMASLDEYTYESTNDTPKTVKLVDWTTNTTIWTVDVPVGKELVCRFYDEHDTKNATRPTLMRWGMFDRGHAAGELHYAIPAPDAAHRRMDVEFRKNPDALPPPEPAATAR